jgi:NADPH-dependent 2,4-dienoyl-CoA reductase/sulfur reductase-like enzyme
MSEQPYSYIIAGAGLAGASAVEGIRERDKDGPILLIGLEKHLPYDRPPLSKKLWFGQKKVEDIFVHDEEFYRANKVELALGVELVGLDDESRTLLDSQGQSYHYDKLLLATGGVPRRLSIPGGDLGGISYYRYLDDYVRLRSDADEGKSAVVIGGGFIGSEMAAALSINKLDVTMVFPEPYLVHRVFPESLGRAIQERYIQRGVRILAGDAPVSFEKRGGKLVTRMRSDRELVSDVVIVGIGIAPSVRLAELAGLATQNGIIVNEYLQTSNPSIYAAGDNAFFSYQALGQRMRIEHWDNALNQGKHAGLNMAGANQSFTYMPYFFSDLFEFGYEAVGDVNSSLQTFAGWQKENDTGVVYYLEDGKVRGAMMCNVWDKVEAARELIRKGERMTAEDLRGAIG